MERPREKVRTGLGPKKYMQKLSDLLEKSDLVKSAYSFAQKAHFGQKRKTGEPFFTHPKAAAQLLCEWEADEPTIAAALLHDIVEDTGFTVEDIRSRFGDEVAFLVEGVTNIKKIHFSGLERDLENLRKFVLYLSRDVRVILVKLADRLHNMKTLYVLKGDRQRQIALETMEVYAQLAYRLGMYPVAGELEDLAFPYIYPQEYKWLIANVQDLYEERLRYSEKFSKEIAEHLKKNGILDARIESRAKRYTSLYKKLLRYDMQIDKVHDLVAVRIILKTKEACYEALRLLHQKWPPAPGGFDDYIERPKPSGYRSIHTDIYGPGKKIIEVQIKTEQMHKEAELGVAARIEYDRFKNTPEYALGAQMPKTETNSSWLNWLIHWRTKNSQKSIGDIFGGNILVLSPKKEVIELPLGSTAIDFAYKIHEEIGSHAISARVNEKEAPLSQALNFGDVVQIITDPHARVKKAWLRFAKTRYARSKIKSELLRMRQEQKQSLLEKDSVFVLSVKEVSSVVPRLEEILKKREISGFSFSVEQKGILRRVPQISILCPYMRKKSALEVSKELEKIENVASVYFENRPKAEVYT